MEDAFKKNLTPSQDKEPSRYESETKFPEHAHPAAKSGLDAADHPEPCPYPAMLHGKPLEPHETLGSRPLTRLVHSDEDRQDAYDSGDWRDNPENWDEVATGKRQAALKKLAAAAKTVAVLLLCLLGLTAGAFAQTVPTQTTLSAAVAIPSPGSPSTTVIVASATGISAPTATSPGTELYVDDEAMVVQAVNGTTLTVFRGYDASNAGQHSSGSAVYAGPVSGTFGSPFVIVDPPAGGCTLSTETYTMRINTRIGRIWVCGQNSRWQLQNVAPLINASTAQSGQAFAFDRASGVVYTLPTPALGLNYRFITTVAQTSAANEVQTALTTSATLFMQGVIIVTGTTTAGFAGVPTTSVAWKTNDTTTGGLIGGDVTCTGISATLWQCVGVQVGSGTVATPFVTSN